MDRLKTELPLSRLDELGYFKKKDGRWQLKSDAGIPPILDMHSHMGWSYGRLGPNLDVGLADDQVKLWYDYEKDSDVLQVEDHPTEEETSQIKSEIKSGFIRLSPTNKTQTAGNLRLEMRRMGHHKACIHPIATSLMSKRNIRDTFLAHDFDRETFIPFAGTNMASVKYLRQRRRLEKLFEDGAKGVKYHPEFQFAPPYKGRGLGLLKWCAENDKLVIAHTGDTGNLKGIPKRLAKNSSPCAYRCALEELQEITEKKLRIVFAHAGLVKYKKFIDVANEYTAEGHHVWLETSGLPVPALLHVLGNYDTKKILYGNDWGFYPLVVSLARMLLATESFGDHKIIYRNRKDIFYNNAARLLGLDEV